MVKSIGMMWKNKNEMTHFAFLIPSATLGEITWGKEQRWNHHHMCEV